MSNDGGIIRNQQPKKGFSTMIHKPMRKRAGRRCRARGLLLLALWLGLSGAASAQSAEAQAPVVQKTDVRYAVDFDYLRQVAPSSVAWLYQPDTDINQPVVFSSDATYYLRRRFDDSVSSNGAIFMTGEEAPDFTAPVVTIYGKNCYDYSLFGILSEYRDDAFYQAHPTLYLITPEESYQLDIFAGIRTKLADQTSWNITPKSPAELYRYDLPSVLERSFITPLDSALPTQQDAWAVLATDATDTQGYRYILYARKRRIDDADAPSVYVNQLEMDSRETVTRYVSINGVGRWLMYAQNDPLWKKLTFEAANSGKRRPFGDGGCGPTAVAMAIANLVDKEDLPKLSAYASSPFGYRFCTCSVNDFWCSGKHLSYQLTTPDEFLRYFPLAIASFATGNNLWGVQGRVSNGFGTNMNYLNHLGEVYNLSVTKVNTAEEAVASLRDEGTIAIACTTGFGSPFTATSHFLVLAGADDDYLYVMDPLQRESYPTDSKEYLEIITPGLVRIRLENASRCNFAPIYLLARAAEP